LNSSVLAWPDREVVDRAVRQWARQAAKAHPEILRIGYFGSYARGDWGVGSDLDLILIVDRVAGPFERRNLGFELTGLPVPADTLVYTQAEWEKMAGTRFGRTVRAEAVWVGPA
jgi:predicted nucleotidyltransferase